MKNTLKVALLASAMLLPISGFTADGDNTSKADTAKVYVKDSVITTKVKAAFAKDDQVSASHIKVNTENHGVVKLGGHAKTQAEADKAVSIARGIEGVTSVENSIKVGE